MKVFQLKLCCNKNAMPKKILLFIILLSCWFHVNAQEATNRKLVIEAGFLPLSENSYNLGLLFNIEPKIKIGANTFIGLKFGLTVNSHVFENKNSFQFYVDDKSDHGMLSFVPTFDYYFNENNLRPYLGVGLGFHLVPYELDVYRTVVNPSENVLLAGKVDKCIGFLLRGGVELGKLRLGLEYNFISRANIEIQNDQIIGTVENSYLGLSIGFVIRGGKSSK